MPTPTSRAIEAAPTCSSSSQPSSRSSGSTSCWTYSVTVTTDASVTRSRESRNPPRASTATTGATKQRSTAGSHHERSRRVYCSAAFTTRRSCSPRSTRRAAIRSDSTVRPFSAVSARPAIRVEYVSRSRRYPAGARRRYQRVESTSGGTTTSAPSAISGPARKAAATVSAAVTIATSTSGSPLRTVRARESTSPVIRLSRSPGAGRLDGRQRQRDDVAEELLAQVGEHLLAEGERHRPRRPGQHRLHEHEGREQRGDRRRRGRWWCRRRRTAPAGRAGTGPPDRSPRPGRRARARARARGGGGAAAPGRRCGRHARRPPAAACWWARGAGCSHRHLPGHHGAVAGVGEQRRGGVPVGDHGALEQQRDPCRPGRAAAGWR